ncbi:16138_t:CDS:2 [Acaulospora colombiana]|uniref:16138_t:CDS:1 n=1 Tax=Acaulospora colombiana TaxID=27376 RepID=A0ACA9KNR3_9GLOM|nr:16138_t:CDS:2 [Acaulospora colombiana]
MNKSMSSKMIKGIENLVLNILIYTYAAFSGILFVGLPLLKSWLRGEIKKFKDRSDVLENLYTQDPYYGKHKTLVIDGCTFHYVEAGNVNGPLVLFIHGFPEYWYSWRHQLEGLREMDYHLVAVDMRGYGGSYRPREVSEYNYDLLLGDIRGFIQELSPNGRAAGGVLSWQAAAQSWELDHADKSGYIERLIILNAPHTLVWRDNFIRRFLDLVRFGNLKSLVSNPRETVHHSWEHVKPCFQQFLMSFYISVFQLRYVAEKWMTCGDLRFLDFTIGKIPGGNVTTEDLEKYKATFSADNFSSVTGGLNYYRGNAIMGLYNEQKDRGVKQIGFVGIPTLVIWGEKDQALQMQMNLDNLGSYVSNLKIVSIPEAGHFVQQEVPEKVNDIIRKFITSKGNLHDLGENDTLY